MGPMEIKVKIQMETANEFNCKVQRKHWNGTECCEQIMYEIIGAKSVIICKLNWTMGTHIP